MLRCYREKADHQMLAVHLPDELYAQAAGAFVFMCVDILIVHRERRAVYLAKRRHKPMADQWWFIGGRRRAGETILEGAQRCFKRETGLQLAPARFVYRNQFECLFADREQDPQETGAHTRSDVLSVELSSDELAQIQLDPEEYDGRPREFGRAGLAAKGMPRPLLDAYNCVFPTVGVPRNQLEPQPLFRV